MYPTRCAGLIQRRSAAPVLLWGQKFSVLSSYQTQSRAPFKASSIHQPVKGKSEFANQ
jgi:hypothetical protein